VESRNAVCGRRPLATGVSAFRPAQQLFLAGAGRCVKQNCFVDFSVFFLDPKHPQIQMVGYQLNDARDDKTTPLFPSKRFQKSSVFFLGCEKGGPPCSIAGKLQVLQGVESERNCEPCRRQLQRSQRFP